MAATVARHLGAEHTEIGVNFNQESDVLDRVFLGLDEPFADASAVPTFLISAATRREVTVVLTGDGADEVFAGYRRYWAELYLRGWNIIPASLKHVVTTLLAKLPEGKHPAALEYLRRARRFVETSSPDPALRQTAWMRLDSGWRA